MFIRLARREANSVSTIGDLLIEDQRICATLEDAHHVPKIPKSTRIPAGTYPVTLRTEGGHHEQYLKRFGPDFHKGMLHINDVPGFEFILIHCGNTIDDTEGCVLTGTSVVRPKQQGQPFVVGESEKAYRLFYPRARDSLLRGEGVVISVIDEVRDDPAIA
jgi:uncharacterized protein DUF5675